ncbi:MULTISPECIES: MCE family protein [unclassified Crossiella]|uniref:MCE family protein n=1 Tax=unclassified Crossiella TaxID=2620835 RepID=UPI001FFFCBEE|nr:MULTISPECIES: MCE family protein [unclassified Crossiella]MCK2236827.1 MCE family protein [Crossiella sp. S99.2]MCK2250495.1 MCE family protein [Crossiella sp. S99.1]
MTARSTLSVLRRRLLGVVFLAVIALVLGLTVSVYRGVFEHTAAVTLRTDHIGNQLMTESDVKVRGLIVGEVKRISSKGDGAELELALQPDKLALIPKDVTARLLPKTLFGERYVALVPGKPGGGHLAEGDVISQDRSSSAIELERVLSNLMPVLQAVQPQKLAGTLGSMATALDGRGEQLGETLTLLNRYLRELNPALPDLKADISALADVSGVYDKAAPDLLQALAELTTTTKTVAEQRSNLQTLYTSVGNTSADLTGFLAANRNNLIRVAADSRPLLDVLAKYAPEYPCFLKGMTELAPRLDKAFGKGTSTPGLRITMEITANRGKYVPNQDEPRYADKRGPRCYDIHPRPEPFPQYPPDGPVKDGSKPPPAARSANDGLNPPINVQNGGYVAPSAASGGVADLGIANSPAEQDFLAALIAGQLGVAPQQVPSWASLVLGPALRGTEVTLR